MLCKNGNKFTLFFFENGVVGFGDLTIIVFVYLPLNWVNRKTFQLRQSCISEANKIRKMQLELKYESWHINVLQVNLPPLLSQNYFSPKICSDHQWDGVNRITPVKNVLVSPGISYFERNWECKVPIGAL